MMISDQQVCCCTLSAFSGEIVERFYASVSARTTGDQFPVGHARNYLGFSVQPSAPQLAAIVEVGGGGGGDQVRNNHPRCSSRV